MIKFYIERRDDDLLNITFYRNDNTEWVNGIRIEDIDEYVFDYHPKEDRTQIFERLH